MINLLIDPRDPELVPLGPSADGAQYRPVTVSVAPSRVVRLTGGGFLWDGAPLVEQIPTAGSLTVSVPATDGTEILIADRSTFEYVVTVTATRVGRNRSESVKVFRGLLPTSLGATVQVTNLVNAEPLPAPYTSIQDIIDGVADVNDPVVETLLDTDSESRAAGDRRWRVKGSTIRPDDFAGATDHAKLQACVNYACNNGYPTILMDRMLNLTGADPIVVTKQPFWHERLGVIFEGTGGGIIKHDAGVVFTSSVVNSGDLIFHNVKYISTPGAGAILIDADTLIRVTSSGCEYKNWDMIVRQIDPTHVTQTMRFHNEKITGGAGPAFLCREVYDVVLDNNLCEDRLTGTSGGFFANSDGAMTSIANRALRITNNVIENNSGIPLQLAMCWGATIAGNYFESNGQPSHAQIDLYTLAVGARQTAVDIRANMLTMKPAQETARTPAILMGTTLPAAPVVSSSNVCDSGIMWRFGPGTSGPVIAHGDYMETPGLLVYPGQEDRYLTRPGKSVATASRPKSPTIGEPYFDSTLGKPVWPKTAGTKGVVALRFSAGASSSGNITITIFGVAYVVAVTAGDTAIQVRDKVVAAAATFAPTWATTAFSTFVSFESNQRGALSGALSFSGGTTGVTQDYFVLDVVGTNPVWVDATGATV